MSDRTPLLRRYRVGIRLLDWMQGFGIRLLQGILDHARERGVEWDIVFDKASGGDLPPEPIGADWQGDGLIVYRYTAAEARAWRKRGIHVVNLSVEHPAEARALPRVTVDGRLLGRLAADHLASLGLKRLAFFHDPDRLYSIERYEAFRERAVELGCEVELVCVPACRHPLAVRPAEVERAAWKEIGRLTTPCGLFAKDDISAMVALRAAKQLGIRCPQELAVVSVNDDPYFCETARPPLSSIRYPGRQAGYTVSALLQDLMDGRIHDDGAIHLRLPPGPLVRRESTGQIELEDPVIRKSLEIIRRETANGKVSVDKLARRVGVSRELLRQRFLAVLGRGPKQEVDFARLAYLESQLATTNLTLESLAEEAGFSGPDDLSRFFKRMKGQSPGEFRRIFRASG